MANRLAQSQSLYLRKHAENPIDWWPWCDEALKKAKEEDKPIFLSIGYSSCHWCTVMEGEAFSDWQIADYMNAYFVPIKVDREERPDIDSIYMQTLQIMTGQGGWPLNVFLSPDDCVPFYGGTYFPIDPKYGRAGFLQVLQAIRRFYDTEKDKLQSMKGEIFASLQQQSLQAAAQLNPQLLSTGLKSSTEILASKGRGPSFPMIPYAETALHATRFNFPDLSSNPTLTCQQRGLDLALGGIFDCVAGGFHRYTVDSTWTVPHFEKMLYDNGQIVEYLAQLWANGMQEPAFERAIALTVQWLQREMTAPAGYFYAAQDADNFTSPTEAEPEEGAFYVWDYAELQQLLSYTELAQLVEVFTVTKTGNFEGHNVLQRRVPLKLTDFMEEILSKLFVARYGTTALELPTFPPAQNNQEAKTKNWTGRIPPVTDTKMIVAWNSLMISGLARAATVFQSSEYLKLATTAANFILNHQWVDGRLHRINYNNQPGVLAQSEDYAFFIKALLDLHQASLAIKNDDEQADIWLTHAVKVQAEFDEFLWSVELGGYYNTDPADDLLVRERNYVDSAIPSANGVAVVNLVRLALLNTDLTALDRAEQTLQAFGNIMERSPQACPSLFTALDWFNNSTLIHTSANQIASLAAQYFPTAVYTVGAKLPEDIVGSICQGMACLEPAHSLDQLLQQLHQSQSRG